MRERLPYRCVVAVVAVLTLFTGLLDLTILNLALSGLVRQFGVDAAPLATVLGARPISGGAEAGGAYQGVRLLIAAVGLASILICLRQREAWEGIRETPRADTTRTRRAGSRRRTVGAGHSVRVPCGFSATRNSHAYQRADRVEQTLQPHLGAHEKYTAGTGHVGEHLRERWQEITPCTAAEQELLEHRQIIHAVFEAQREAVHRLRDRSSIGDALLRRIERDLDVEEQRMMANVRVTAPCHPSSRQSGNSTA